MYREGKIYFFDQTSKIMADIDIEKKERNKPVWPWILGVLLLIGVIWAAVEMGDNEQEMQEVAVVEEQYEEEPIVTDPQANIIEEEEPEDFVAYVEEEEIKRQMGVDHEVTGSALLKLSEAIREVAWDDDRYSQQINELEQTANEIQSDPQSLQHADKLSNAFSVASNVLQEIQQNRFPEMQSEVEEVKQSAAKLEGSEQLLNQKEEVKAFFEKTAEAVESMREEMAVEM